jgi:hypothetical protein
MAKNTNTVIIAQMPEEYREAWIKHLQLFEANNPEAQRLCHLTVVMDVPDDTLQEMIMWTNKMRGDA